MSQFGAEFTKAHALSEFSQALRQIDSVIGGSFTYEDALVFSALLAQQSVNGISGDLLEIGTLMGKTAAVLGLSLKAGERLHVCDLFEVTVRGANDAYSKRKTEEEVRTAIIDASGCLSSSLLTYARDSRTLEFEPETFRFIHVDGDHRFEGCLSDLRNSWRWLVKGGVLAVDDHCHPDWPEVAGAVEAFLNEASSASVLLDFNRRGAKGRKIMLVKSA